MGRVGRKIHLVDSLRMENPPISAWENPPATTQKVLGEEFRFQGLEVRGYVDNSL